MQQPCQYGFKCPYRHYSEDYDYICTYPYINPDDGDTFGFPDEGDCALMECDSDLEKILATYENSDAIQKEVDKEWKRMEQENIELVMEMYRQIYGDDEEKKEEEKKEEERVLTMDDIRALYEKCKKYWEDYKPYPWINDEDEKFNIGVSKSPNIVVQTYHNIPMTVNGKLPEGWTIIENDYHKEDDEEE